MAEMKLFYCPVHDDNPEGKQVLHTGDALNGVGHARDVETAQRIHTCVNALQLLSNEQIEQVSGSLGRLIDHAIAGARLADELAVANKVSAARAEQVVKLEDDLRAALKLLDETFPDPEAEDLDRDLYARAQALIRKHGG